MKKRYWGIFVFMVDFVVLMIVDKYSNLLIMLLVMAYGIWTFTDGMMRNSKSWNKN